MQHFGSCHCGNITVCFETSIAAESVELRRCVCSFCLKHGAISATDPQGSLAIQVADEKNLSLYRFGLRTADFVVCSLCGVYLAALLGIDDELFATLNVNTLKDADKFTSPPKRMNYEKETAMEKVSRRQENWTPATLQAR